MTLLVWVGALVCAHAGFPVRSVAYSVDVDGPLAEVTIEQVFVNDSDAFVEAIYVFPLHEEAAVDGMRMEIDGRLIEGRVLELGQATERYDEALDQGHAAALTTQQRPNVFTQRVGNLPPGGEIRVVLRVVQPVPHVDGAYELTLPLVVAPRFVDPDEADRMATMPMEVAGEGPPLSEFGTELTAHLDVIVDSGLPFVSIESPSHEIGIAEVGETARAVTEWVPMDRDFVLRWAVSQDRPVAAAFVQSGHAIVTLEPPETAPRPHVVPREIIWVIDQSCSMSGAPIQMVRSAMHEALQHMDSRDSLRILRFSNTVEGDAESHEANAARLAMAHLQIDALGTSGGTYLLDGVNAALDTRPDPERERYVVFLTDGLIGTETDVLATIADRVGDARLFAFGVGSAPNRWLLDEMARFGGGETTWIRSDESAREGVQRFIDTIDRPVLTDIRVDWGDWKVTDEWPRRLPALYAGQPLLISTRVLEQGTTPVVVRGRLGDGAFEQVIVPTLSGPGRAIPSTWARQKIANLERDQVWGEVPELAEEILRTSLESQVLSQYTAFLAVDYEVQVNPSGAPDEMEEQPADVPFGTEYGSFATSERVSMEITVSAERRAIDTASAARGTVLTKDFLDRVPAGRTYQSAVQMSAGGGGNPNLAGGAFNENTYLLDGANTTDPVTGTFSLNFNYDALQAVERTWGGWMPEQPGTAGTLVDVQTRGGNNNLEGQAGVYGTIGVGEAAAVGGESASGSVAGPIVRDRLWLAGAYSYDRSATATRDFAGHTAFAKLTTQLSPEHRLSLTGTGELAAVDLEGQALQQGSGISTAQWSWYLSSDAHLATTGSMQQLVIGDDERQRRQASLHFATDFRGHALKVGGDVDRVSWQLADAAGVPWLVADLLDAEGTRGGLFAQDSWRLSRFFQANYGLRVDQALDAAHVAPRAWFVFDPSGEERARLIVGGGRSYGQLGLPVLAILPAHGLTRLDELAATAELAPSSSLVIGTTGTLRARAELASTDGRRVDRDSASWSASLRRLETRRWAAELSYTYTRLLGDAVGTLIDDGAVEAFAHAGSGSVTWALPTDPNTTRLGFAGSIYADPFGSLVPDPGALAQPNVARTSAGVRVSQDLDLRRGVVTFDLEAMHLALLEGPAATPALLGYQAPWFGAAGFEGPRIQAGMRGSF